MSRFLLKGGADARAKGPFGYTSMHDVAEKDDPETIEVPSNVSLV